VRETFLFFFIFSVIIGVIIVIFNLLIQRLKKSLPRGESPETKMIPANVPLEQSKNNQIMNPEILSKIWDIVGPTNISLPDPDAITSLGFEAVPATIHVFTNPTHKLGSANQAILASALVEFAQEGNEFAARALQKAAEGKIELIRPFGETAFNIATRFIQNETDIDDSIEGTKEKRSHSQTSQENLAELLQVGMSLSEIIDILGPPTASMGGGQVVDITENIGDSISSSLRNMMSGKMFMEWDRPEGIYKLVIENNRLANIFTAPGK